MSKKISLASLDLISGSCCVYASKRDKNYAKQKWKVYKFSIDTFRFIQIFFRILIRPVHGDLHGLSICKIMYPTTYGILIYFYNFDHDFASFLFFYLFGCHVWAMIFWENTKKKLEIFWKKKSEKKFLLRYRYQNWTLVSVVH